jgi:hypothetical protein
VGFLNSLRYTRPDIQRTFRDVTEGHTVDKEGNGKYRAGPGWDMVTGWGGPDAEGLLRTLPRSSGAVFHSVGVFLTEFKSLEEGSSSNTT